MVKINTAKVSFHDSFRLGQVTFLSSANEARKYFGARGRRARGQDNLGRLIRKVKLQFKKAVTLALAVNTILIEVLSQEFYYWQKVLLGTVFIRRGS